LVAMAGLLVYGILHIVAGDAPPVQPPPTPFPAEGSESLTGFAGIFLILRAFASGSVALTGAEAVANGTPSLRPPEARSGTITVLLMGSFFATIFLAISFLAAHLGALPDLNEQETVISVIVRSLVGVGPYYYVVQISTSI